MVQNPVINGPRGGSRGCNSRLALRAHFLASGVATLLLILVLGVGPALATTDWITAAANVTQPETTSGDGGVAFLGDLDGDGLHAEVAFGVSQDHAGGRLNSGAMYICWLNPGDGSILKQTKLANGQGGVPDSFLEAGASFGSSIAVLGHESPSSKLAVGGPATGPGSIWIVWIRRSDGYATSLVQLTSGVRGIPAMSSLDYFGCSVAALDDPSRLLVGAYGYDNAAESGSFNQGTAYVLSLDSSGNASNITRLTAALSGWSVPLLEDEFMGRSVHSLGDMDSSGQGLHIAVGAVRRDSTGGVEDDATGAVFVMRFRTSDNRISNVVEISSNKGGLDSVIPSGSQFGSGLAFLGELDDSGWPVLLVGAYHDNTGALHTGAAYMLWMNRSDGTVRQHVKLGNGLSGVPADFLPASALFGRQLSALGYADGSEGFGAFIVRGPAAILRLHHPAGPPVQLTASTIFLNNDLEMAGGNSLQAREVSPPLPIASGMGVWLNSTSPVQEYVVDGQALAAEVLGDGTTLPFQAHKSWRRTKHVNVSVATALRQLYLPVQLNYAAEQAASSVGQASAWPAAQAADLTSGVQLGASLIRIGDANGDGCSRDILIGMPSHDTPAVEGGPAARADSGGLLLRGQSCNSPTASPLSASVLIDGQQLLSTTMLPSGARLGSSLAWLGSKSPRSGLRQTFVAAGTPGADAGDGAVLLLRLDHDENQAPGSEWDCSSIARLSPVDLLPSPGALSGSRLGTSLALANAVGEPTSTLVIGAPTAFNGQGCLVLIDVPMTTGKKSDGAAVLIAEATGGLPANVLSDGDAFGTAVAWTHIGAVGASGSLQLMVGAPGDDLAGTDSGCVHLLTIHQQSRTVATHSRIATGGMPVAGGSHFGASLAWLGDVDGDGTFEEVLAGAPGDAAAAVLWVRVASGPPAIGDWLPVAAGSPGVPAAAASSEQFGSALAAVGDWNGDGVASDVLIGDPLADGGNGSVTHVRFSSDGSATPPWGDDVQLEVTSVSPHSALPFDQPTLIRINGTALYEWDPLAQKPSLAFPPTVLISGLNPRGCDVEEVSVDGEWLTCWLSQSLEPNRTLRVKAGQAVSATGLEVSYDIRGDVQAVDDQSPLLQSGGDRRRFSGEGLLGYLTFSNSDQQAAGVGQLLIGSEYKAENVLLTPFGRLVECQDMPAGVGGPHPVRLQLPGGVESNTSVTVSYEAATVSQATLPTAFALTMEAVNVTITGTGFGHRQVDVPRIIVGGNDCLDIEWRSSTELHCAAVQGNFTDRHVVVYTGTPSIASTGGAGLLQFEESLQVLAVTPAVVPTVGNVTITCYIAGLGERAGTVSEVRVGNTRCLSWSVVNAFALECVVPAGTGADLFVWIESNTGILSPSVLPVLSYEAPTVTSSSPAAAFAGTLVSYTFVITGSGFGVVDPGPGKLAITVAGQQCAQAVHIGDMQVECRGVNAPWGSPQLVSVTVDGQSASAAVIEFQDPPVVTGVVPASLPTTGGAITITGSGFGDASSNSTAIHVGDSVCTEVEVTSSLSLTCTVPAGVGADQPVLVVVPLNGNSSATPASVSYNPPQITSVGLLPGSPPAYAGMGSVELHVSVQDCGEDVLAVAVNMTDGADWEASCLVLERSDGGAGQIGSLRCVGVSLGRFPTTGGRVRARVAVAGQVSTSPSSIGLTVIGRPEITAVDTTTAPTLGLGDDVSAPVQLLGSNLGLSRSDVLNVTVGGVDCPLVEWNGDPVSLHIAIPPGVGTQQRLKVTTRGGLSDESDWYIDYEQALVNGLDPAYGLTGSGTASFNVTGSNFGNGQGDIDSIHVGGQACGEVEWLSPTMAACFNVSRSRWTSKSVVVKVGGQRGADNELFTGIGRPVVTGILPSGTGWPTAGDGGADAFPIQLVGSNFGRQPSDVASVSVGGEALNHVQFEADSSIRIAIPPGVGAELDLVVTTAGGWSSAPLQVSYQPAEVAGIDPVYALTGTGTASFNVTGQHFGNKPSDLDRIQVGEQDCSDIEWVSSTRVVCHAVGRSRWESRSVTVTVGGQEGLKNSYFEAVGDPVIEVVSPAVADVGEEVLVLGKAFGQQASDIVNVTVLGVPCSKVVHRGSTALSCTLPRPPVQVAAAAAGDPTLLRDVPLVVWNAAGKQSAAANVSYSGSGNPLTEAPTHLLAWRPVGQPRRFTVRWAFPTDEQMTDIDDVESFTIEVSELLGNSTPQEVSVGISVLEASAVTTSEGLRVFRHEDFVFTESTVSIRIRAVNPTGDGPWSEATPPVPATCTDGTFLQTQVDASRWECGVCPVGAFCGGAGAVNVTAQPGFWRVPWSRSGLGFSKCPREDSCLGYKALPPKYAYGVTSNETIATARLLRSGSETAAVEADTVSTRWHKAVVASKVAVWQHWQDRALAIGVSGGYEACAAGAHQTNPTLPQPPARVDRRLAADNDEDLPLLNETLAADEVPTAVELRLWGDPVAMERCEAGYYGTMCTLCQPGYTRWGGFGCRKCQPAVVVGLAILGLALLMAIVVSYLIVSAIRSGAEKTPVGTAAIKVAFSHIQTVAIAASFNLQWPDSVLSLFAGMSTATSVSSEVLSLDCALPSDSKEASSRDGGQSRFFDKAVVVLLMPLLMLAVAAAVWALIACCWADRQEASGPNRTRRRSSFFRNPLVALRRATLPSRSPAPMPVIEGGPAAGSPASAVRSNRSAGLVASFRHKVSIHARDLGVQLSTWDKLLTSTVVILFLVHMSVTTTSLQLLTCRDIAPTEELGAESAVLEGDLAPAAAAGLASATASGCKSDQTHRRLVQDLEVCCYDKDAQRSMFGLGVPGLVVYAFGIPVTAALLLWWRRDSLHTHHTKTTLGFLYAGFKGEAYYWESVVMLRKVLVAVIAVSLEPMGVTLQTYTALAVIAGLMTLQARVWPYSRSVLNQLELGALGAALVTFECGLFLTDPATSRSMRIIATMVVFFANLAFLTAALGIILWDKLGIRDRRRKRLQGATSAPKPTRTSGAEG